MKTSRRPGRALGAVVLTIAVAVALAAALAPMGGAAAPAAFPPDIPTQAYVIVDDQTGAVLAEKNGHERRAPASITKIVTAIVTLEHRRPTDLVRVRTGWYELYDSTLMGLIKGEYVTIEDLLYGLILMSGNDAALELAREVGGSETNFIGLMNDKVHELGLTDTHFANPHGLDDPDHFTSAYDITMLGRYAMRIPDYARIAGTQEIIRQGRYGYYPMHNKNAFIFTYPGADGVKNGFTDNALQTLVGSFARDGRRYFVGMLGCNYYPNESQILLDGFFEVFDPANPGVAAPEVDPIDRHIKSKNPYHAVPWDDGDLVPPLRNGKIWPKESAI